VWTANNYAVQEFLTNGISQKARDLFEEAHNRAVRAGEYNDSTAARNFQVYETASGKVVSRIAQTLSGRLSGSDEIQTRLRLIQDLILSNRLDEAEVHLNEAPYTPMTSISKQLLQGLLLKRKMNFKAAAAAFRSALRSLEKSDQATEDSLSNLRRMAALLEENARAASTVGLKIARQDTRSRYALSGSHQRYADLVHSFKLITWGGASSSPFVNARVEGKS
jgi:hypothetical protein